MPTALSDTVALELDGLDLIDLDLLNDTATSGDDLLTPYNVVASTCCSRCCTCCTCCSTK